MADENTEKKVDRGIIPKSTQRDKAKAAIEAILGKQPCNPQKDVIKPFALENSKNGVSNSVPISIVEIKPAKKDIPELDLDQRLMADQRKLSAVSRQRPGERNVTGKESVPHVPIESIRLQKAVKDRRPLGSRNQIIKEIVAKDIAKMYQKAIFAKQQKIS